MPIEITNTIKRIRLNAANQEPIINDVSCKFFKNLFLKCIIGNNLGNFFRMNISIPNKIINKSDKNTKNIYISPHCSIVIYVLG